MPERVASCTGASNAVLCTANVFGKRRVAKDCLAATRSPSCNGYAFQYFTAFHADIVLTESLDDEGRAYGGEPVIAVVLSDSFNQPGRDAHLRRRVRPGEHDAKDEAVHCEKDLFSIVVCIRSGIVAPRPAIAVGTHKKTFHFFA